MPPEIVERARGFQDRLAIVDRNGSYLYRDLLDRSAQVARTLLGDEGDLEEAPVGLMVPPSFDYVAALWGIWRAGGLAVPIPISHPPPELAYLLDDARPRVVIGDPEYESILRPLTETRRIRYLAVTGDRGGDPALPPIPAGRRALMLYTSGTTGRAKGVVTTHANLAAQVLSLVSAWEWSQEDRILLTLPLHHVHGIVNVVACALWSGAVCEMHPQFNAETTWERLGSGELSLYMAVPTIYHRLIEWWVRADPAEQERMREGCRRLRLMVSGSAALPVPVLEKWREVSGHTLLERYGMTEIGMALSNPLHGRRRPGEVGAPLPGVEVRLVDESGRTPVEGQPGEIQVRGPTVFLEYWGRPDATEAAFTEDGWFLTGDVAVFHRGSYRILGRASVDIIKTGGEKISALEVEDVLLAHGSVRECAVIGMEDPEWGQRLVAAVVPVPATQPEAEDLGAWCRERLAPAKVPKEFHFLDQLPRNAMGKVSKPALADQLGSAS